MATPLVPVFQQMSNNLLGIQAAYDKLIAESQALRKQNEEMREDSREIKQQNGTIINELRDLKLLLNSFLSSNALNMSTFSSSSKRNRVNSEYDDIQFATNEIVEGSLDISSNNNSSSSSASSSNNNNVLKNAFSAIMSTTRLPVFIVTATMTINDVLQNYVNYKGEWMVDKNVSKQQKQATSSGMLKFERHFINTTDLKKLMMHDDWKAETHSKTYLEIRHKVANKRQEILKTILEAIFPYFKSKKPNADNVSLNTIDTYLK